LDGWKESRESETRDIETDVDVLTSEIHELQEDLSTNQRLLDMLKEAVEAGGDDQKREELLNASSELRLKIKKVESQLDLQNAELEPTFRSL